MSPSIRRFVAYYRVSTARHGRSGLGLEAQKAAVLAFIDGHAELVAEFTEVESGKHGANTPKAAIGSDRKLQSDLIQLEHRTLVSVSKTELRHVD